MLQIRLLGQFDVRLDGRRIVIPARAGQSLFAYLALTAGTLHRREKLAGLFWPDVPEEKARTYLRHELWRIRKAIPPQEPTAADNYLIADEYTLTFNRHADYWLDVAILERPDLDLESLTASLSLYQGELLPGFFDEWIVLERERIQTVFESKMEQLVEKLVEAERWTAVQEQCERWLALGNASEPAYRALMLSHSARGDMAKVSSTYQRCVDDLQDQFGVEPSTETRALYNGLLKGARAPRRVIPIQPSGTVTFLFTDIEGSTRLLDKLGEQYTASLVDHHQILRAAIQKWNGSEMDTQGDAFLVTFTRALDAVQCAAEAQRALANHAWPYEEPIRVRMGLHTGEPLIASTGYVGMDVHRAARIGDAGYGGQVLLSQATRELVTNDLPPGITLRDLGEHRLKDMKYPTPIYQLVIEGLQASFPPLKTKFTGTEAPTPGDPPFKGLQYFDESDSDLFFGRELLTAKLVNRLHNTQFLSVIIGASGSGKSSLVRAGLIPALKKGNALLDGTRPPEGSADWQIHIITPTAHPLEALATELTRHSESVTATAALIDDLAKDPRSLSLFLSRNNHRQRFLLVVDQFEELFTLCRDEFEREAFIDNLLTSISGYSPQAESNHKLTLVLTLRADFYAHLAQYPELRDLVAQQQEYIGPMTTEELRRAIEEPAKRAYWEFEPGLVDLILRDVGDEPGALPLLSHALLETWKRRAGHRLTLKGYADAGGVRGAIAHTAESVYRNLSPDKQTIARGIFLRLTEFGEGTEDTRRRASFGELMSPTENRDEVHAVLSILAEARLITLGEESAEVAHEALIREWPTLREWLNQDREGLVLHRHLTEAAQEWELLERDAGSLYRGARLAQINEWSGFNPKSLNMQEKIFLDASNRQARQEEQEREEARQRELAAAKELAETQRQSASRLRMRNRLITTVGTIAIILAMLAGVFGLRSNRNAEQAETNLGIANEQRVAAVNAQATAQVEVQIRATQQAIAEANFNRAEAQRLAAEANRLLQSGGNSELIALLSLRSIDIQYSPQGDSALLGAARLHYPRQLFEGHTAELISVAFSPDGKYVLTGSFDKTARLWNVATGQEVRQFTGHTDRVSAVAFSPDGKYILTGSEDRSARLWDALTGQEVRRFISPGIVLRVAYSPNGKYVLTDNLDKTARLWDAATGEEVRQFIGHLNGLTAVAFSPDGQYIATASDDGTARLWKVESAQELHRFTETNYLLGVAFSPDGNYLLTGSADNTAYLWDVQTGQEVRQFSGHTGFVVSAVFSPDGKYILTSSFDGTARLWDVKPISELPSFDNMSGVNAVALAPDGKVALTGGNDGIPRLWDISTGRKLHDFIGHTDWINYGVTFSSDGKYALTGSWDKTVRLWNPATGQELRQFTTEEAVNSVVFSPNGKYILIGSFDKTARLWDIQTGEELRQFIGHTDQVYRVAFSPDGKYIATASADGTARLWNIQSDQELREFTGHTDILNSITFSPDGKYILTSGNDRTARLWDAVTGQELRQFIGHTDLVYSAFFSPDGEYVATASADGTARLWDTQTEQELRRFTGHTAGVENVVFSPDGKYILTGSDDGTARLWDVDYHDTMHYLCLRLLRDFTQEERAQYGITDEAPTCPAEP